MALALLTALLLAPVSAWPSGQIQVLGLASRGNTIKGASALDKETNVTMPPGVFLVKLRYSFCEPTGLL